MGWNTSALLVHNVDWDSFERLLRQTHSPTRDLLAWEEAAFGDLPVGSIAVCTANLPTFLVFDPLGTMAFKKTVVELPGTTLSLLMAYATSTWGFRYTEHARVVREVKVQDGTTSMSTGVPLAAESEPIDEAGRLAALSQRAGFGTSWFDGEERSAGPLRFQLWEL